MVSVFVYYVYFYVLILLFCGHYASVKATIYMHMHIFQANFHYAAFMKHSRQRAKILLRAQNAVFAS